MNQDNLIKLKDKFTKHIEKMRENEYVGDAGAGMVRVTVKADMRVMKVEIDHTMFAKTAPEIIKDLNFLADLFKAATNQAIERGAQDLAQTYGFPNE